MSVRDADADAAGPHAHGRVEGILVAGQSLAEGGCGGGSGAKTEAPAYPDQAWMLSPRPVGLATRPLGLPLRPLREDARVTVAHSLTRRLVADGLARDPRYRVIVSGQAWGGKSYRELAKGGPTGVFELQMAQVALLAAQVPGITYRGVVCIHGEQDGLEDNARYADDLVRWQADFSEGIRALTRQREDVALFICQTSSAAGYGRCGGIRDERFPTPLAQLAAHESNAQIHLVTPKYHLPYHDSSHLTNIATRILGEYFAKALLAVRETGTWSPLRPARVRAAADAVLVDLCGNEGPIVFDTERVKAAENFGFSYADDASRSIRSVSITGPAQVEIRLDGPAGPNGVVAYAYHNGAGGGLAQIDGRGDRGNLRDSSRARSDYDDEPLYNWCVTFRKPVSESSGHE